MSGNTHNQQRPQADWTSLRSAAILNVMEKRMNRAILLMCLLWISPVVFAFECYGPDKYQWSLKQNYEKADSVFFAQVIYGTSLPEDSSVKFEVLVNLAVKGNAAGHMSLSTGRSLLYPPIELAGYYLFFLYGDNKIDMCDPIYNIGFEVNSIEALNSLSERKDLEISQVLSEIASYINSRP